MYHIAYRLHTISTLVSPWRTASSTLLECPPAVAVTRPLGLVTHLCHELAAVFLPAMQVWHHMQTPAALQILTKLIPPSQEIMVSCTLAGTHSRGWGISDTSICFSWLIKSASCSDTSTIASTVGLVLSTGSGTSGLAALSTYVLVHGITRWGFAICCYHLKSPINPSIFLMASAKTESCALSSSPLALPPNPELLKLTAIDHVLDAHKLAIYTQ